MGGRLGDRIDAAGEVAEDTLHSSKNWCQIKFEHDSDPTSKWRDQKLALYLFIFIGIDMVLPRRCFIYPSMELSECSQQPSCTPPVPMEGLKVS